MKASNTFFLQKLESGKADCKIRISCIFDTKYFVELISNYSKSGYYIFDRYPYIDVIKGEVDLSHFTDDKKVTIKMKYFNSNNYVMYGRNKNFDNQVIKLLSYEGDITYVALLTEEEVRDEIKF